MITCIQTEFFLLVVRNIMLSNTPLPLSSEPWGGDKNRIIITVIRVLVAACGLTLALHALLPLLCRGLCSPTAPWPVLCTFRLTPLLRRRRHAVSLRGALCWNLSCWAAGGTGAGGITCWFYGGSQQTHIIAIRIGSHSLCHVYCSRSDNVWDRGVFMMLWETTHPALIPSSLSTDSLCSVQLQLLMFWGLHCPSNWTCCCSCSGRTRVTISPFGVFFPENYSYLSGEKKNMGRHKYHAVTPTIRR